MIDNQILSTGYNGICRGVDDAVVERIASPEKYFWFEHAERNACYAAAREGIRLKGATMFTQDIPCADCCRGVIQSGIAKIVIHKLWRDHWRSLQGNQWVESQDRSQVMLDEAGVVVETYTERLGILTLMKGRLFSV